MNKLFVVLLMSAFSPLAFAAIICEQEYDKQDVHHVYRVEISSDLAHAKVTKKCDQSEYQEVDKGNLDCRAKGANLNCYSDITNGADNFFAVGDFEAEYSHVNQTLSLSKTKNIGKGDSWLVGHFEIAKLVCRSVKN